MARLACSAHLRPVGPTICYSNSARIKNQTHPIITQLPRLPVSPALMASCAILDIPHEITELALIFSSPSDVANFAQTCKAARDIVYGNDQHL